MPTEQSADRGERATEPSAKPSPANGSAGPAKLEPPSRSELAVDRLTHQDVNEVCALYKRVWDAQKGELKPEMIKAWEPTPLEFTSWMEGVTYFIARRGGKPVGIVGLEISHNSGRIVHLAVDPDERRHGVATALIRATIDWAKHSSCTSIWADALSRFSAAADLLLHLGFQESGRLHKHEWGEDVRFFEELL